MKYFKIILLLISFQSISSASMYLDKKNVCIEDYYTKLGRFYYLKSRTNRWNSTTTKNYSATILPNYIYDANTSECRPDLSTYYGVNPLQFNFLLGLIGVIFGAVFMFFTINAFVTVGGKK